MSDRQPAIDLTRHAFVRTIGDMTVYGTWLYNDDQEDTEPALVIIPAYRLDGVKPCCIALSAAYRYTDGRYVARASRRFALEMGFEDSVMRAYKIAELIYEHLPDLIAMPVDPTQAIVVGEATVDLGNGRRTTVELLDHEQERQA